MGTSDLLVKTDKMLWERSNTLSYFMWTTQLKSELSTDSYELYYYKYFFTIKGSFVRIEKKLNSDKSYKI